MEFLNHRSPVFSKACIASSCSPLATQVGLGVFGHGGDTIILA